MPLWFVYNNMTHDPCAVIIEAEKAEEAARLYQDHLDESVIVFPADAWEFMIHGVGQDLIEELIDRGKGYAAS
jgi:hypothetical protein